MPDVLSTVLSADEPASLGAIGQIVPSLREAGESFGPFDPRVLDFTADLARALRTDPLCRESPAIAALAYWIRPANVARLQTQWEQLASSTPNVVLSPRGVVFHLPPSNVDTIFVYSWVIAALVGNANVMRISKTAGSDTSTVLSVIEETASLHPEVSETMAFVRYGHEEEITRALSTADLRVIWGGDETVNAIRKIPVGPSAADVAFGDRYSMAVLDAASVAALDASALQELARRFYNDSYWFDQLGCSSPRAVFWRGEAGISRDAQIRFVRALKSTVASEGYVAPVAAVMNKLAWSASTAAAGAAELVDWHDPNVTYVRQPSFAELDRSLPGAGLFLFRHVDRLQELVPLVTRRDQTLSYFGVDRVELEELVAELNGRGIDRVVPVGSALQFDRFWDGLDLLAVFARRCSIQDPSPQPGGPGPQGVVDLR